MGSAQAASVDAMGELSLTEHDIRRWVGEASFGRGLSYYRGGAITQPNRQGQTLHARCSGTEKRPYRLWVTLDAQGIVKGNCTCYVGDGGQCKHVAALLLTLLPEPDAWTSYIADLRKEHRRLRALQDELNRAGLE